MIHCSQNTFGQEMIFGVKGVATNTNKEMPRFNALTTGVEVGKAQGLSRTTVSPYVTVATESGDTEKGGTSIKIL